MRLEQPCVFASATTNSSQNSSILTPRGLPAVSAVRAVIALLLALESASAVAGTVSGPISDGLVYVSVSGSVSDRPSCAATTTYFIVPNENSEVGKKLYAALLGARLANQQLQGSVGPKASGHDRRSQGERS